MVCSVHHKIAIEHAASLGNREDTWFLVCCPALDCLAPWPRLSFERKWTTWIAKLGCGGKRQDTIVWASSSIYDDRQKVTILVRKCNTIRTYAVARLCANVACSNPANSALGPARNCCMAGRMISSLVSNQLVPVVIR